MSMQFNALPASAGAEAGLGASADSRAVNLLQRAVDAVRGWLQLRRQLAEIQILSDRELSDIGLGEGEIHRLRRGDLFCPTRWTSKDTARDQLPI